MSIISLFPRSIPSSTVPPVATQSSGRSDGDRCRRPVNDNIHSSIDICFIAFIISVIQSHTLLFWVLLYHLKLIWSILQLTMNSTLSSSIDCSKSVARAAAAANGSDVASHRNACDREVDRTGFRFGFASGAGARAGIYLRRYGSIDVDLPEMFDVRMSDETTRLAIAWEKRDIFYCINLLLIQSLEFLSFIKRATLEKVRIRFYLDAEM